MNKFLAIVFMLVLALPALAGFQGFNSSTNLGVYSKFKCSTGLTCTNGGNGVMSVTSSPSLTSALTLTGADATAAILNLQADRADDNGDSWQIQAATTDFLEWYNNVSGSQLKKMSLSTAGALNVFGSEGADGVVTISADESDDNGDDWQLANAASDNSFSLSNDTSGSQVAKVTVNTAGDVYGPGAGSMYGFLQKEVAATATTITAAQCGSTFYNSGAVVINLPNGSAGIIGCRLTFITANASNFDVNPGNSDQILVLTNANGDAIRNATLGNTVVLQYGAANQWYEVSAVGTWTDIN
jgi:hypothetical protein